MLWYYFVKPWFIFPQTTNEDATYIFVFETGKASHIVTNILFNLSIHDIVQLSALIMSLSWLALWLWTQMSRRSSRESDPTVTLARSCIYRNIYKMPYHLKDKAKLDRINTLTLSTSFVKVFSEFSNKIMNVQTYVIWLIMNTISI